jgi:hypothetical protein
MNRRIISGLSRQQTQAKLTERPDEEAEGQQVGHD